MYSKDKVNRNGTNSLVSFSISYFANKLHVILNFS